MSRFILKFANGLVSLCVGLALLISGLYAGYALWDNQQIYAAAEDVQADMIQLKPQISAAEEDSGPSFEELLAVNPDVCAWVSLDGTNVDHPVLQGETNFSYLNTDVYGNFALAGSIFLDTRCDRNFAEDQYHLLYGHNMASNGMFGDLKLYKDETFFEENRTGMLILPDRIYDLEIFACIVVASNDDYIFDPDRWQHDISGLMDYARENALHLREETLAEMESEIENGEIPHVLTFSTCSSEFTDARTILLTRMKPYVPEQEDVDHEENPA